MSEHQRAKERVQELCSQLPSSAEQLKAFITQLASNAENQLHLRAAMRELAERLAAGFEDQSNWNVILDVGEHAITAIHGDLLSLDEPVAKLYEVVADVLEKRERWVEAAEKLAAIPLQSGQASFSDRYKLHIYLRIGALYLEEGDPYRAETFVLRAANIVGGMELTDRTDEHLIKYKVQCARVDDAKRKFTEAAQRYIELAYMIPDQEARSMALSQAVNCAVLSPAGTARARHLATLYKDERCHKLPSFDVLAAMYFGRIVRKPELARFASQLQPHQKAITADNTTFLDRAVVQHNMVAASHVYCNISFEELSVLLEVSPQQAESIAAEMMSKGSVEGSIDQVAGRVYFASERSAVAQRDGNIERACNHVNRIVRLIQNQ